MRKPTLLINLLSLILVLAVGAACAGQSSQKEPAEVIEPTPTLTIVGSTMEKPVPYTYDIILEDIVISISEINRPADKLVQDFSQETPLPGKDQEFLLVRINNQCVKPGLDICFVGQADFQLIDAEGNLIIPVSSTSGADGFYTFQEFSSGTSNKGYLTFLVDKGAEFPFLTYKSYNGGDIYLALSY